MFFFYEREIVIGKISLSSACSSIADNILGTVTTQPKAVITAPPLSGPGSGVVAKNVPGTIELAPGGPYLPNGGVCVEPTPDTWDFQFRTFNFGVTGGPPEQNSLADVFVQLPRPVKKIFLVSMGNTILDDVGIFLHFIPLGKSATASTSYGPIDGSENWIPFPGMSSLKGQPAPAGGVALVSTSFVELCKPMSKLYIDILNSGGSTQVGGFNITLLFTDDVSKVYTNAT